MRPEHPHPVVDDVTGVARGKPVVAAVRARSEGAARRDISERASGVRTQQLAVDTGHVDARQRRSRIDDARTRLGHAPGGHDVGGYVTGWAPASEKHEAITRQVVAKQLGAHDGDVGRAPARTRLEVVRGSPHERGVGEHRPQQHRQPSHVARGQARVPGRPGSAEGGLGCRGARARASQVSSAALGAPLDPDVSIDERRRASSTSRPPGMVRCAVCVDHVGRAQRSSSSTRRRGDSRRSSTQKASRALHAIAQRQLQRRAEFKVQRDNLGTRRG